MPKRIIIFALIFVSFAGNAFFLYDRFHLSQKVTTETDPNKYPYLSKRIFASEQNDIIINFIPLRTALNDYTQKEGANIGVYFEYLPSGTSIGVNDRDNTMLSSLSKVPLAMSIYKKSERGRISLDKSLVVKKEELDKGFGSLWEKGEGTILTIKELLRLALANSDNTAYNVLFDQLTPQEINEVYENLDIPIIQKDNYAFVSPKNYSSIFRSLYLASFLTKEDSSKILEILTQTPFNDQIRAGVPEDILVAHKIGVFETVNSSQAVFIDCGIVYVPNRPYILCVFVKDTDGKAQEIMSHISKMIYEYIVKVKGGG